MNQIIPADVITILMRIDTSLARLEAKVDAVMIKQDDHEFRIRSLETWQTAATSSTKTGIAGLKLFWMVLVIFAGIGGYAANGWVCGFRGDRAHHSEEFPPGIPS